MMRMKTKTIGLSQINGDGGGGDRRRSGSGGTGDREWEMRPGGMLVQKRTDSEQNRVAPPTIRVRVKFQSGYHEINISSQATFGELKKMLSGPTGLHHEDQKLLFKHKERDSKAFLDVAGVKDRSKIVLVEDPISLEKRYIEMKKNAKLEKALKSVSEISLEVDRLAVQVSNMESIISKGGKVAEKDVLSLTELLMNQLLKLDGIFADGDVKLQRKMQERRVQKYVETLDMLMTKSSTPTSNGTTTPKQQKPQQQTPRYLNRRISSPNQHQQPQNSVRPIPKQKETQQDKPTGHSPSGSVVITTQWETFDVAPSFGPTPQKTTTLHPKFDWDLL